MKIPTFFSRLLTLALFLALVPAALAQDDSMGTIEEVEADMDTVATAANAEARDAFAAAVEAAQAANEGATAEGYVMAAEKYLEAADIADASGDAELEARAADVRGNASKAFVNAGSAYSDAEEFANAAAQFERAADVAREIGDMETGAKTYYNAGVTYVTAEDFESAVTALDAAIEMDPENLDYYYVRGIALSKSGDTESSETAFAELAERAEESGNEEMMVKVGDTVGKAYLIEANASLKAGRYNDAVASLDKAAPFLGEDNSTLNKLYASAYYKMGVGQVKAEQFSSAQRSLSRALEFGRKAGLDSIVNGARAQLDYIEQVQAQG